MLLWNGLLVLLAGFPWNMARPQLHLLWLTVKKLRCQASYFTLRPQNLQHKTHPEFWPSHRWIFKTSLYYKTRLILETRRYLHNGISSDIFVESAPWSNVDPYIWLHMVLLGHNVLVSELLICVHFIVLTLKKIRILQINFFMYLFCYHMS